MFNIDPAKKQKVFIITFILVVLCIGIILYFRYGLGQAGSSMPSVDLPERQINKPLTAEDLEIFNDPLFKDLEIQKDFIDNTAPVGRDNPFAPL